MTTTPTRVETRRPRALRTRVFTDVPLPELAPTPQEARLDVVLRVGVLVAALGFVACYLAVALTRFRYPYQLEWMEGGVLLHVQRVLNGQQLYGAPSLHFTPFLYTPLYYYVSAGFAWLVGLHLSTLRIVSIVSSLVALGAVYRLVWLETRNPGGHSSQPRKDNAIYQLADALARLEKYDFPVALNDTTLTGHSRLSVGGDLRVEAGATLLLGCDPQTFPCIDDNPSSPTLSSRADVDGNLIANQPLGVVVHNTGIGGNVDQDGGGGGFTCTPTGIFMLFNSPVYSAYEDSWIHGSVSVTRLTSCWLGLAGDHIRGNVRMVRDQLADPDAVEILYNHITGNLVCLDNSAAWDSAQAVFGQATLYPRTLQPNTVHGDRVGQCVLASPATQGGPPGPGRF